GTGFGGFPLLYFPLTVYRGDNCCFHGNNSARNLERCSVWMLAHESGCSSVAIAVQWVATVDLMGAGLVELQVELCSTRRAGVPVPTRSLPTQGPATHESGEPMLVVMKAH